MTNYTKAIIYMIVIIFAYSVGAIVGGGIIPSGWMSLCAGFILGLVAGIVGKYYFWDEEL
jgi:hypothetical protein